MPLYMGKELPLLNEPPAWMGIHESPHLQLILLWLKATGRIDQSTFRRKRLGRILKYRGLALKQFGQTRQAPPPTGIWATPQNPSVGARHIQQNAVENAIWAFNICGQLKHFNGLQPGSLQVLPQGRKSVFVEVGGDSLSMRIAHGNLKRFAPGSGASVENAQPILYVEKVDGSCRGGILNDSLS